MGRWARSGAWMWLLSVELVWGQGYTIQGNQIVVNTKAHWLDWNFPEGTVAVFAQGEIQPHLVRKNVNAALDILEYLRQFPPAGKDAQSVTLLDAIEAGSNKAAVAELFDEDETTYWEPAADAPLRNWWIQVDLGRIVSATRIVLKFVAEGQGDPFLHFVVLTSDGEAASLSGKGIAYNPIYRTLKANKNQRVFEIELYPSRSSSDREFVGDMIRFVQVVVTGSDGERGTEVSQAEYAQLQAADRGAVEYYKKVADGEVQVSRETYEVIDASRRGAVRHYRREHPRLAELEVWTLGENVALGIEARKGIAVSSHEGPAATLVDGQFSTLMNLTLLYSGGGPPPGGTERFVFFDLGSFYWLDTNQIFYNTFRQPLSFYKVQTSDGSTAPDGSLIWTTHRKRDPQVEVREAVGSGNWSAYHINRFPPIKARFFRIVYSFLTQGVNLVSSLREIQLFSEGYQPDIALTSGLIDLGEAKNLVSIEWEGDTPPGTSIQLQTRTGDQVAQEHHYFNKGGGEVTQGAYEDLNFFQRGRIDTVEVAGADWSDWSVPYQHSGGRIASPSPRKFLMLRARLTSDDPQAAAALRAVRLNFVRPVAQQLLGEVNPGMVEELGTGQELSLFIKPSFTAQSLGFDELLLHVPPDMKLEFRSLRVGREAQWETGGEELIPQDVQIIDTSSDSLWVRLDRVVRASEVELIEVRFATALFSPGAVLQALLGNSSLANSWQRVDPGDATSLVENQEMRILGPVADDRILGDVEIKAPVLTPNGDGINDEMIFAFSVRRLSGQQNVRVQIYDLAGSLRRQWEERRPVVTGRYTFTWAGHDQGEKLVPPGIYLLRIGVDVDSHSTVERTEVQRLLHVVY